MTPDLSEFQALTEAQELRQTVSRLQAQLRRAKAKTADLVEAVYVGAKDAALVLGSPPAIPKPKPDRRTKRPEVALLHCSDWHFGKHTPSFDSGIAAERILLLGEKMERLTAIERADHPVHDIHILLGGDMVENVATFAGQVFEVDSTLFAQMMAARMAAVTLIRHALSIFEGVHVWLEAGNHGRLAQKGQYPAGDNADEIVYELARSTLEGEKRLVWHPSQGWHSIVEIGAYRALLVHGDEIKSFGGSIPAFGISRKVDKWSTGVVAPFTDTYMGHFHSPMVLPIAHGKGRTFVDPSIESGSVFANEFMASDSTPGQRLNFVDPDRGRVTSERLIWLD